MPEATEDQLVIEKTPRYFVVKKAVERMQVNSYRLDEGIEDSRNCKERDKKTAIEDLQVNGLASR